MSRSKRFAGDFDDGAFFHDDDIDLEGFLDSMVKPSAKRRRNRKFRTRQYLDDLEERRWLRKHLDDWDTDGTQ